MKKILPLFFIATLALVQAFAQTDTTTRYFDKSGKETAKDSAVTYVKFFRQANLWHGMQYDAKRNLLTSEGDYNEINLQTAVGSVNHFLENGTLDYTLEYADGKPLNKTYFYKSGDRKSYTVYGDNGIELQKGWDEKGKELKNFIVEREVRFKGGEDGWKNYVKKNLNETIPRALGLAAGNYEVVVQFTINTDGVPTNIKAISVPPMCKACGTEALRVVKESPAWDPAILNNVPIAVDAVKTITFEPIEGVKKG